ncbi:MAG: hypothetical protein M1821_007159 [Bathelium mastoideum]|nr:MAG: hypothetical protein M1821_007159 [Bathelium mastoideum]KAI9694667.1 MAG: hypothetical protein M1822_000283 [Bathelium mastoideum]
MSENTVLVTGGCGFVGFHIVSALLNDKTWPRIHVMSRNPSYNRQNGVIYHAADITSFEQVGKVLAEVKPSIIIHSASPPAVGNEVNERDFLNINVAGTRNLLEYATTGGYVKAFVYTSSASIMLGPTYSRVTEDAPTILSETHHSNPYSKSKALADKIVLEANGKGGVLTATMRICSVYGERDNQAIPGALKVLRDGKQKIQIGDNQTLFDVTSVENVATAHLLAVKNLSRPAGDPQLKVDGEAFLITEDDPLPFWTFERKIWTAAGDETPFGEVKVVPAWLILSLAALVEWMYYFFTLGTKRPKTFRRELLEYTCRERTFCIDKAKTRLGYHPTSEKRDEHIRRGVEWALQGESKDLPRQEK